MVGDSCLRGKDKSKEVSMIDRIDPTIAAQAYAKNNVIRGGTGDDVIGESGEGEGGSGGVSFADFLKDQARESVDTLRQSESMSAKAVTGEADLTDVVQAVTAAELTLQTVVSVRDRVISAYQEIMRMPI